MCIVAILEAKSATGCGCREPGTCLKEGARFTTVEGFGRVSLWVASNYIIFASFRVNALHFYICIKYFQLWFKLVLVS